MENVIQRYRSRGVLVDTNILLLFVIGSFDRRRIPGFKRTSQFTVEDYDLLVDVLNGFEKIVTTPCILAEVSNLAGAIKGPAKTELFQRFARAISVWDEQYVRSDTAAIQAAFPRLGLTDAGIIHISRDNYLVLTDDLDLYIFLERKKIDVINFNHLRSFS